DVWWCLCGAFLYGAAGGGAFRLDEAGRNADGPRTGGNYAGAADPRAGVCRLCGGCEPVWSAAASGRLSWRTDRALVYLCAVFPMDIGGRALRGPAASSALAVGYVGRDYSCGCR